MKVIYILTSLFIGEPESERYTLWAIESKEDCETVAEIFSINSEGESFMCIPREVRE